MQKKLVVLFGLVLLAFTGLSIRLIWLTRENGTRYQKQVLAQQQYDSITLPYRRGDIVDAKGTKLATSEKVYNLVIDAKVMNTELNGKTPYLEPTLEALGQYFDLDMTAIREYVATHKEASWYVPLKRLTYDEISGFQQAKSDNSNIKGVWFEEEYKRVYPYGSLAADTIGFTSTDNQGSYGLEEYYNSVLNGINGREYGYLNDDLNLERTVKAAVDGSSVHSTIDANVQMIVEKYLAKFMEEFKDNYKPGNGAENVGCIIQWVNTGEILAMASVPTYDLNNVRDPQALLGSMMVEKVDTANGYYFTSGQILSEVENAAKELAIGEISDVIESDDGFHILLRLPKDESYITAHFDELKSQYQNARFYAMIDERAARLSVTEADYVRALDAKEIH